MTCSPSSSCAQMQCDPAVNQDSRETRARVIFAVTGRHSQTTSNYPQRLEAPEDVRVERAPEQGLEAIVAIPVRNEAGSLTACLSSLVCQVDLTGRPIDPSVYEILFVLNNCIDDSATVLRNFIIALRQAGRVVPRIHLLETALVAGQDHVGWAGG
jgi:hypothetical protein